MLKCLEDMILVRLSKILLTYVIAFVFCCGCSAITEFQLSEDLNCLESFEQMTNDPLMQSLYKDELSELREIGATAYTIMALSHDLDGDGIDEIISYYESVLNSGSGGNIDVDIWSGAGYQERIVAKDKFALNPDHRATDIKLLLTTESYNNFPVLLYEYTLLETTYTYKYGRQNNEYIAID